MKIMVNSKKTSQEDLVKEFQQLGENDQRLIIFLYEWGRPIRPGVAAEYLKMNHPTLNMVMERLKQRNLVNWERYKQVALLQQGKEMAAHQLNHHEVIHQYLVHNLGLSDEEAHEESIKVSGVLSCKTVEKMKNHIPQQFETDCSLIVDTMEWS